MVQPSGGFFVSIAASVGLRLQPVEDFPVHKEGSLLQNVGTRTHQRPLFFMDKKKPRTGRGWMDIALNDNQSWLWRASGIAT